MISSADGSVLVSHEEERKKGAVGIIGLTYDFTTPFHAVTNTLWNLKFRVNPVC